MRLLGPAKFVLRVADRGKIAALLEGRFGSDTPEKVVAGLDFGAFRGRNMSSE